MGYIRVINEDEATGTVAEDYTYLAESYGTLFGFAKTPNVYRTSSLIPSYFRYGTLLNRFITNNGKKPAEGGPLPRVLVNFGVAAFSACFY